jgi:hypothetical protein
MNRKKSILISTIVIIVFIILGVKYWSIPILNTYECQSFTINGEDSKEIEIRIDGEYKKSLFQKDYIDIYLKVGDVEYPLEEHIAFPFNYKGIITSSTSGKDYLFPRAKTLGGYRLPLKIRNGIMFDLEYTRFNDGEFPYPHEYVGSIVFSKDLSQIVFFPYKSETIIASGLNRKDAEELWHHLVEKDF